MAEKMTAKTVFEKALLEDANDLLDAIYRYGMTPTPQNWVQVDAAATSLSDTTYGTFRG